MLFFLKPIFQRLQGVLELPAQKAAKKKKKVYKVVYDRKTPTASEVDWSAYNKTLFRVDQRKAQEKREREDLLFLTAMLEGAL